jgi:dienelactone hydrolase
LTAAEEYFNGSGRHQDQATNPEYLSLVAASCAGLAADPAGCISDPYRTLDRWSPAHGEAMIFSFANRYGAMLRAEIFSPALSFVDPVTGAASGGPFPAVVVIPGHQEPRQEYRWAAQGLAESGYVAVVFDPQGFGESEVHPNPQSEYCDPNGAWRLPQEMGFTEQGSCAGEPPADYYNLTVGQVTALAVGDWSGAEEIYREVSPNFVFGALDTLAWLLSSRNPWLARIDSTRVGVAGHSLGAYAAMMVGNGDPAGRFDAAVAWDGYNPMDHGVLPAVPTLFQQSQQEEALGPTYVAAPDPEGFHPTRPSYRAFATACVPAGFIVPNASSHHEWAYGTGYGASRYGERVGHYFTLAWLDLYLKGKRTTTVRGDEAMQAADASSRLNASAFDGSADRSSRGAGSWDPVAMRNVPYTIGGQTVASRLSPFYSSEVNLSPC